MDVNQAATITKPPDPPPPYVDWSSDEYESSPDSHDVDVDTPLITDAPDQSTEVEHDEIENLPADQAPFIDRGRHANQIGRHEVEKALKDAQSIIDEPLASRRSITRGSNYVAQAGRTHLSTHRDDHSADWTCESSPTFTENPHPEPPRKTPITDDLEPNADSSRELLEPERQASFRAELTKWVKQNAHTPVNR